MNEVHSISDASDCNFADFESIQSFSERNHGFQAEETLTVFTHAHGVINGDEYFVVSFAWKSSSQPNLIVPVMTGDERNNFLHVETFTGFEVAL